MAGRWLLAALSAAVLAAALSAGGAAGQEAAAKKAPLEDDKIVLAGAPGRWPQPVDNEEYPPQEPSPRSNLVYPTLHKPRGLVAEVGKCPSTTQDECSSQGRCVEYAAFYRGVRLRTPNSWRCKCDDGWTGPACQYSPDAWKQLEADKKALKEAAGQNGRAKSVSDALDRDPYRSLFTQGPNPTHHAQVPWRRVPGTIYGAQEPRRPASLASWVNAPAADYARGAQMIMGYEKALREEIQDVEAAHVTEVVQTVTRQSKLALYTNAEGRNVVGPVLYQGQKTFELTDEKSRDPTIVKLVHTLNAMYALKDKDGNPLQAFVPQ